MNPDQIDSIAAGFARWLSEPGERPGSPEEQLAAYLRRGRRCSIEGCDKRHDSKGLCGMHNARLRRTGSTDPRPIGRPPGPIRHGTYGGSFACARRCGEVCPDCREARIAYKRARRALRSAERRQSQEAA